MKELSGMTTREKQEAVYRRNYLALLSDALFFSMGFTMFSTDNVLPVYISNLSDKTIYIAVMTALFLGVQYSSTIFSCMIGVNAKSPKWISLGICFLQRIGFMLIFCSTFFISKSLTLALVLFFVSLVMYACSSGMSSPLFTQMITYSIHKNVGSFMGVYSLVNCFGGVLATSVFTYCLGKYEFPLNFRMAFLFGTVMAVVSTITVAIFLREVTDDRVREHIQFRDVFQIGVQILRENGPFRRFVVSRVIAGAADFTVPYYILYVADLPGTPQSFLGIMATVYLASKMIASALFGKLADKFGTMVLLRIGCICGITAAALALLITDYRLSVIFYCILAFGVQGVYMANSIASLEFSQQKRTPFYAAIIGVCCAPIVILTSFTGAAIAKAFSFRMIFGVAIGIYLLAYLSSGSLKTRNRD